MYELKRKKSPLKVIFSPSTGNWLAVGKEIGIADLERVAKQNPFSTYELREITNLSNETNLSINILGATLETLCLDDRGNPC